jgi:hypothetical protein
MSLLLMNIPSTSFGKRGEYALLTTICIHAQSHGGKRTRGFDGWPGRGDCVTACWGTRRLLSVGAKSSFASNPKITVVQAAEGKWDIVLSLIDRELQTAPFHALLTLQRCVDVSFVYVRMSLCRAATSTVRIPRLSGNVHALRRRRQSERFNTSWGAAPENLKWMFLEHATEPARFGDQEGRCGW